MKSALTIRASAGKIPPVTSKWGNARLLSRHPSTAPHVPVTRIFNRDNLKEMIARFPSLYLKPVFSCRGKGILRVDVWRNGGYLLRKRDPSREHCRDEKILWSRILRETGRRPYVIQQSIQSVTREGRPFDIRVHLVRIGGKWVNAGIVGKLAGSRSIVTNRHSGGKPKPVRKLLLEDLRLTTEQTEYMTRNLEEVARRAVLVISRHHPKWWEFGVDAGIDSKGRIWIYEVNITPGGMVFKAADRDAFRELLRLRRIARRQAAKVG
ncbi:YheC/D-like protein [Melghirimyces profundicolus]|uniref:YheC/D-like protein n=1 Tax=Melghirimyces profundicolus TaxID=1242148 RepID=A0A2T6BS19_9BACL|nr:YheC/YheD family protein [Melghirimyces profundicolus]PTX58871.1 YheC/D-like protein [Melghirimyces profundicolus]